MQTHRQKQDSEALARMFVSKAEFSLRRSGTGTYTFHPADAAKMAACFPDGSPAGEFTSASRRYSWSATGRVITYTDLDFEDEDEDE